MEERQGRLIKKPIANKLMKYYVYAYILTIIIGVIILAVLCGISKMFFDYNNHNLARDIMKDNYSKINIDHIQELDGTAFIIDNNLNVIRLCGEDFDKRKKLTMSELTDFLGNINTKNSAYSCSVAYNEKNKFWLITKIPVAFNLYVNVKLNTNKKVIKESIFIVFLISMCYFGILFIYMAIYSKITAKYFIGPLEKLCYAIEKLSKGKREHIEINTNDEFQILFNNFNEMTDSLEREKKLTKVSEENRKQMIMDISHDLKNPLTSIIGSLELCLNNSNDIDVRYKHYLNMAYENSIRVNLLINNLFEYSKLDSVDYKLDLSKIDFCEFLRTEIASEIEFIEEAGFIGIYKIPDKPIYLKIDKIEFGRVIHNLISNTLKYNTKGTEIQIILNQNEKNAELIIKDNGIGIDKETAKEVFNKFVRGNRKDEAQTYGNGLGLSIAKRIVNMHNGTIQLKTDINMGCDFIITIPIC